MILFVIGIIGLNVLVTKIIPAELLCNLKETGLKWVFSYYFRTGYFPMDLFSLAGVGIGYSETAYYILISKVLACSGFVFGLLGFFACVG